MTTFLIIVGGIVVVYATIWLYLLKGYRHADSEAFRQFYAAWQDSSYTVLRRRAGNEDQRVRFKVGNNYRYMVINTDGELISKINWEYDSYSFDAEGKPSRRLKKLVEVYSTQISTMHKLEYNL
jgi:hypothetical protein